MMVQLQQEARKRKQKAKEKKNVIINKLLGTIIYISVLLLV
jgi:amino acid permease